jgi:prophage antirepressor-like protein
MSSIQLFDHPSFGSLTTFSDENGEKYFKANDICIALRLSNPSQQLTRHVKEKWKKLIDDGLSNSGSALYVSKPGLYALIFRSKTPQADIFQDWVFEEVLPKLDAEGGYIMPSATLEQLEGLQAQVDYQKGLVGAWEAHLDHVWAESRKIQDLKLLHKYPLMVASAQIDLCGWASFSLCNKELLKEFAEFHSPTTMKTWVPVCYFKGFFERATGRYVPVRVMTAWLAEWGYAVKDDPRDGGNLDSTFSYEVRMRKLGERATKAAYEHFAPIKKRYKGRHWHVEGGDAKYHAIGDTE